MNGWAQTWMRYFTMMRERDCRFYFLLFFLFFPSRHDVLILIVMIRVLKITITSAVNTRFVSLNWHEIKINILNFTRYWFAFEMLPLLMQKKMLNKTVHCFEHEKSNRSFRWNCSGKEWNIFLFLVRKKKKLFTLVFRWNNTVCKFSSHFKVNSAEQYLRSCFACNSIVSCLECVFFVVASMQSQRKKKNVGHFQWKFLTIFLVKRLTL